MSNELSDEECLSPGLSADRQAQVKLASDDATDEPGLAMKKIAGNIKNKTQFKWPENKIFSQ